MVSVLLQAPSVKSGEVGSWIKLLFWSCACSFSSSERNGIFDQTKRFGTLHDDPDVGEGLHKEGPMEVLDLYDPELDWSAQSPD